MVNHPHRSKTNLDALLKLGVSDADARALRRMKKKEKMMLPYTTNPKSKFKIGQRVRFLRADGRIIEDTVRWCFWQEAKCEPYGSDLLYPALVLTNHSWCAESDVIRK